MCVKPSGELVLFMVRFFCSLTCALFKFLMFIVVLFTHIGVNLKVNLSDLAGATQISAVALTATSTHTRLMQLLFCENKSLPHYVERWPF